MTALLSVHRLGHEAGKVIRRRGVARGGYDSRRSLLLSADEVID
jgi:hypothetical protein